MRIGLSLLVVLGAFGCSSGPKIDNTPNQENPQSDYPPGPYGYVQGSTMENITFVGKADPAGAKGEASYASLAMASVSLADFHRDPTVKYVVLSGVARWCGPC